MCGASEIGHYTEYDNRKKFKQPVNAQVEKDDDDIRKKFQQRVDAQIRLPKQGLFTYVFEGNQNEGKWCSLYLQHPSYESGVTLAHGYDLRHRTKEEVRNHLTKAGVEPEKIDIAVEAVGLYGDDADEFRELHKNDFKLTPEEDVNIFNVVYPEYREMAMEIIGKIPGLDSNLIEVLVDCCYHAGVGALDPSWEAKEEIMKVLKEVANKYKGDKGERQKTRLKYAEGKLFQSYDFSQDKIFHPSKHMPEFDAPGLSQYVDKPSSSYDYDNDAQNYMPNSDGLGRSQEVAEQSSSQDVAKPSFFHDVAAPGGPSDFSSQFNHGNDIMNMAAHAKFMNTYNNLFNGDSQKANFFGAPQQDSNFGPKKFYY